MEVAGTLIFWNDLSDELLLDWRHESFAPGSWVVPPDVPLLIGHDKTQRIGTANVTCDDVAARFTASCSRMLWISGASFGGVIIERRIERYTYTVLKFELTEVSLCRCDVAYKNPLWIDGVRI